MENIPKNILFIIKHQILPLCISWMTEDINANVREFGGYGSKAWKIRIGRKAVV